MDGRSALLMFWAALTRPTVILLIEVEVSPLSILSFLGLQRKESCCFSDDVGVMSPGKVLRRNLKL